MQRPVVLSARQYVQLVLPAAQKNTVVVWMQQILAADVQMEPVGPHNRLPVGCGDRGEQFSIKNNLHPVKLRGSDHDFLMDRSSEMEIRTITKWRRMDVMRVMSTKQAVMRRRALKRKCD